MTKHEKLFGLFFLDKGTHEQELNDNQGVKVIVYTDDNQRVKRKSSNH